MPRGGWRPGAGRPTGSKNLRHKDISLDRALVRIADMPPDERPDLGQGENPLQYMLRVIRDEKVDPIRRDRMAIAAAPYCHPRIADDREGNQGQARPGPTGQTICKTDAP
jgi:hypothetical protein